MCYTSGTTGMPKGVVYSHRSTILHTLGVAAGNPLGLGIVARPTRSCPSCRCSTRTRGATRTSRRCSARSSCTRARTSIRRACSTPSCRSSVTWTAGVPTIWLGILAHARRRARASGTSRSMKGMLVGGSAAPRAMIDGFKQRHGLERRPRLGDDRDLAGRVDRRSSSATCTTPTRTTQFDYIAMQGVAAAVRRAAPPRRRRERSCRGTASRWASSRSAGRGSRAATTTRPSRRTAGPTTAGSRPATSSRSIRAASSGSRTARRT